MSAQSRQEYSKIFRRRKQKRDRRLKRKPWGDQEYPMFKGRNIHYEVAEKTQAINCGGIGAIHQMVQRCGLVEEINAKVKLLKAHVPYHESDHVLNIAYNILAGGMRLEDRELKRSNEGYLNAVGAQRIPDPTTAGDFTRRFTPEDIGNLMESINTVRSRMWKEGRKEKFKVGLIDVDGTIAGVYGECKGGMSISYKGIWGYAPLILSLANTKEVLYVVNRSGNVASHDGAAGWIDRAIEMVKANAEGVCIRGDTDFSLTGNFDRWSEKADFVFGMDAHACLIKCAEELPKEAWKALKRREKNPVKTQQRQKPENVKEEIVKEKGYKNIRLESEWVAEFEYKPGKCKKGYRVVALKKNLTVEEGKKALIDDIRYFFYITTLRDRTAQEVVELANERCNQENVIEQLKNGVNAMRMPVRDLESNWAYMVMAALAWNLKAWFGLLMPNEGRGTQVVKMEFRRFLNSLILLPCQILRTGRKIVYRVLGYNDWLKDFFETWERIRRLKCA